MSNDIIELWKERDEARAEVERLKAEKEERLKRLHNQGTIMKAQGQEIEALKAQLGIAVDKIKTIANAETCKAMDLGDKYVNYREGWFGVIDFARLALNQLEQTKGE